MYPFLKSNYRILYKRIRGKKQDTDFFMTAKINKNSIEMLENNLEDLQEGKGKTKGWEEIEKMIKE